MDFAGKHGRRTKWKSTAWASQPLPALDPLGRPQHRVRSHFCPENPTQKIGDRPETQVWRSYETPRVTTRDKQPPQSSGPRCSRSLTLEAALRREETMMPLIWGFLKILPLSTLWFNLATAVLEISIQEKVKEQGQRSKEKNGRKEVVYVGKRAPHRVSRSWWDVCIL